MSEENTIVVIGATGHFGGRICRRLLHEPNIRLVVSSRDREKANAFAAELRRLYPNATICALSLDHASSTLADDLIGIRPLIVVHAAGPYQGQNFRVAEACISIGSHYIDLADGRQFVQEFSSLNDAAVRRGVLLVAGASTLPGLSSAVIDHLENRFSEIHAIEISIAPAHQTPRGRGTIGAVLSYCGKPFKVLEDGVWETRFGWQNLKFQRYPQLGLRLSGACDVPDLGLFPDYVRGCRTITFHAALEAAWEQLALWLMGFFSRLRIVSDWNKFIPFFSWLSSRLIKFGSETGGMHIRVSGVDGSLQAKSFDWHLTARRNHGPEIPCAPALILIRKLIRDEIVKRGAYPCLGMITLSEFDAEMEHFDIDWKIVE